MKCSWQEGNRITLLVNGDEYYPAVFKAIDNAQQKVILETFIWFEDNVGKQLHSVLLRAARLQKRIAELMEERNKRMRVSADYVLMRLVEIDQMDVLDILNDDGGMKPIAEWPKVWRTSHSPMDIATIKTTQASLQKENGEADLSVDDVEHILKKVKWPDKVKNLELIGKHVDVNAFKERLEVSGTVTIADRMAKARDRVKKQAGGEE